MVTVAEAYGTALAALRESFPLSAQLEATELVCAASGTPRERFNRFSQAEFDETRLAALLKRRLSGEPLAYIAGSWDFCGLTLHTDRRALIPRDDTEALIRVLQCRAPRCGKLLDLCCGTGCLGLAASKLTGCRAVLADISEEALSLARENILLCGLSGSVSALHADALAAPPPELCGCFDALLCNPPYIAADELASLDDSVKCYEPRLALDGGGDGLKFYRAVASLWSDALRPGGLLVFEAGAGQAEDIAEIMSGCGFVRTETENDLSGIKRAVSGVKG